MGVFPHVGIVFPGVNDLKVADAIDDLPIRGVFENKDIAKNIDLISGVEDKETQIIIVGDGSSTYFAIESEIRKQLINYRDVTVDFVVDNKIENLIEKLALRKQKYLFLTTIGQITSKSGSLLSPETVVSEISKIGNFVIFTMEDGYFFDGVVGGYVTSGKLQGESAARLALQFQKDRSMENLRNVTRSPNAYLFDHSELVRHDISLPQAVEEKSEFRNIMLGFYERHRLSIIWTLAVISALLALTLVMTVVSRFRQKEVKRSQEIARVAIIERYQNAMVKWSRVNHDNIVAAFNMATEISAVTLDVKRVSIWLYNEDKTQIDCQSLFIDGEGHTQGGVLSKTNIPEYFSALDSGRRLAGY